MSGRDSLSYPICNASDFTFRPILLKPEGASDVYMVALAYSLVRNQGVALKSCLGLPKSCNKECGPCCKLRRARPEAHICCVALLAKDYGHSLRSALCIYALQATQSHHIHVRDSLATAMLF